MYYASATCPKLRAMKRIYDDVNAGSQTKALENYYRFGCVIHKVTF